jgi:micrococcal nuclease
MRFNEKWVGLLLILIGLGWLGFSYSTKSLSQKKDFSESVSIPPQQERVSCKVLTVYDGDTLGCDLNADGAIQRPVEEIRLLGIDSPEMHYSRKNPTHDSQHPMDEPYAKQASEWLTERTNQKMIYLEYDLRRSDKYGRTLAYIYTSVHDKVSLNQQEVSAGLARLLFIGKNRLHEAEFQEAEHKARADNRGLWGG